MRRIVIIFGLFMLLPMLWERAALAQNAATPIAVVMSSGTDKHIRKSDLSQIYKRRKLFWSDGTKVQAVNLQASNVLRRQFSQSVLDGLPEDLEKYWNEMYFHGISPPYVLSSEESVMRFVSNTPGAIGYVSYCNTDSRVKVVLVINEDGRVSDDTSNIHCRK